MAVVEQVDHVRIVMATDSTFTPLLQAADGGVKGRIAARAARMTVAPLASLDIRPGCRAVIHRMFPRQGGVQTGRMNGEWGASQMAAKAGRHRAIPGKIGTMANLAVHDILLRFGIVHQSPAGFMG